MQRNGELIIAIYIFGCMAWVLRQVF
jgi:hypothetical protein